MQHPSAPIKLLLRVGLVSWGRRNSACRFNYATGELEYLHPIQISWPLHLAPLWMWKSPWVCIQVGGWFYVFRNLPGVLKWREGRLLPIRWGFGILGGLVEFGDRGHAYHHPQAKPDQLI